MRRAAALHSFVVDQAGTTLYAVVGLVGADAAIVEFDVPGGRVRAEHRFPQEDVQGMFGVW